MTGSNAAQERNVWSSNEPREYNSRLHNLQKKSPETPSQDPSYKSDRPHRHKARELRFRNREEEESAATNFLEQGSNALHLAPSSSAPQILLLGCTAPVDFETLGNSLFA